MFLKYSRDDEAQADELGVRYASRAGWDPAGIPQMLTTLGRIEEASDNKGVPNWLATHPAADDRVERVQSAVRQAEAGATRFTTDHDGYIRRIDGMGGMIEAIEQGFPQTEIANASYAYQRAVEAGDKIIVGVNAFQSEDHGIEILQIDRAAEEHQVKKVTDLRQRRDNVEVQKTLDALRRAAEGTENTMPRILDAVRAYATLGEICDALRSVFGTYQETTRI